LGSVNPSLKSTFKAKTWVACGAGSKNFATLAPLRLQTAKLLPSPSVTFLRFSFPRTS